MKYVSTKVQIQYYSVVKPSHLLDHRNPKSKKMAYNVLYCYVLCIVLIYYSHVLNKVSCYTVLVESCCDALHW